MKSETPCLPISRSPGLFYLGGISLATVIGWVAAQCHLGWWTPVGLISLGIGIWLGLAISKLAALSGVAKRQWLASTVFFAFFAVLAEHTWFYVDFRRQWHVAYANEPRVALFRPAEPWTPIEYLHHEISPGRLALWSVDAALIAIGAVGVGLVKSSVNSTEIVAADDANNSDL